MNHWPLRPRYWNSHVSLFSRDPLNPGGVKHLLLELLTIGCLLGNSRLQCRAKMMKLLNVTLPLCFNMVWKRNRFSWKRLIADNESPSLLVAKLSSDVFMRGRGHHQRVPIVRRVSKVNFRTGASTQIIFHQEQQWKHLPHLFPDRRPYLWPMVFMIFCKSIASRQTSHATLGKSKVMSHMT